MVGNREDTGKHREANEPAELVSEIYTDQRPPGKHREANEPAELGSELYTDQ